MAPRKVKKVMTQPIHVIFSHLQVCAILVSNIDARSCFHHSSSKIITLVCLHSLYVVHYLGSFLLCASYNIKPLIFYLQKQVELQIYSIGKGV